MRHQRLVTGCGRSLGRVLGVAVVALATALGGLVPASATGRAPIEAARIAAAAAAARTGAGLGVHHRTGLRQALRAGSADAYVEVHPGCAPGGGRGALAALVLSDTRLRLDYRLTGTGHLHTSGTLTASRNAPTTLELPAVRKGSYRLVLTRHGHSNVVADQRFQVLLCVTARTSCHAVTFRNPRSNPGAEVFYSGRGKNQSFDLSLAPGGSRTVRADDARVEYDTFVDLDPDLDPDDPGLVASISGGLGEGTVRVEQGCPHGPAQPGQNAVQTSALVGCASSAPAQVQLETSSQASLTVRRWSISDAQGVSVASGSFSQSSSRTVELPPGTYRYRSRANRLADPFETIAFDVLRCVEVATSCKAVRLSNPNDVAVSAIVLPGDAGDDARARAARVEDPTDDDGLVTLAEHASSTVPWTEPTATVLALEGEGFEPSGSFLVLASPWSLFDDDASDLPTYAVPQHC